MLDKKKSYSTAQEPETCILIGLVTGGQSRDTVDEHLEELAFLATTAEATSLRTFIQGLNRPDTRTFVGSGKLQEIKEFVEERNVDMLIFDDELSPTQLRNIEREIPERKILGGKGNYQITSKNPRVQAPFGEYFSRRVTKTEHHTKGTLQTILKILRFLSHRRRIQKVLEFLIPYVFFDNFEMLKSKI